MAVIAPGSAVPDFVLRREDGSTFTQDDLKGATTVLVFYPFAFSPVCTDQMQVYEEALPELREQGVTLYGVSTDAPDAQRAFREHLGVSIEQLSDFEPKGETARKFGAYFEPGGMTDRALVLVGPDGVVRWSHQAANPGELPGVNLIFDALEQTPAA
jgi:peroxiredoxin